ncbi:MAG: hypothetical protein LH606_08430 [Cytophagaceae bacterium]|nr:hypothetical protein [Cytophagaceae bacterium]
MKKDRLERFIRDNREAFDASEPSPEVWARLEAQLVISAPTVGQNHPDGANDSGPTLIQPLHNPGSGSFGLFSRYWKVAASVVLVVGLAGWWLLRQPASNTDAVLARVDPQAAQTAFRYASLIETKRDEIKQFEQTDPQLFREFSTEIEELNRDYQRLKTELPQTPNQEELLRAMIQNLQTQVDILNRQLNIINKVKQAKQDHESTI